MLSHDHERKMMRALAAGALVLFAPVTGCSPRRSPPPSLWFDGLPVAGSLADAKRAGFNTCVSFTTYLHCRRFGVTIAGLGPFDAALDLYGSDGSGGFDELTVWNSKDSEYVFSLADALRNQGWSECFTGRGTGDQAVGDQAIYSRKGASAFISLDLSYWATRRFRVIPNWKRSEKRC
jgi:hypothetical protein